MKAKYRAIETPYSLFKWKIQKLTFGFWWRTINRTQYDDLVQYYIQADIRSYDVRYYDENGKSIEG